MATGTTTPEIGKRRGRGVKIAMRMGLVVLLGVAVLAVFQATSLRTLPDVGDPFDLTTYGHVELPDDQNAYTFYRRAIDLFKKNEPRTMLGFYPDWSQVAPGQVEYLESNREAVLAWFEGTKRDRGVYFQPREVDGDVLLPVCQGLRTFLRMGNLEAIRLEHEGDLAGSWAYIRANLRASRHTGQYGLAIERVVGNAHFESASKQATRWADQPGVDAAMLRRALEDVLAVEAITTPVSNVIKTEYYSIINTLKDFALRERAVNWAVPRDQVTTKRAVDEKLGAAYALLIHEPERSRRVARLLFANWLSACDLPAAERGRRIVPTANFVLYEPPAGETPAIPTDAMIRWYESTYYARELLAILKGIDRSQARDERNRASLIVHLAEQLYKREHGKTPSSDRDLVGPYLKAMPVGYVPPVDEATFVGPLQP